MTAREEAAIDVYEITYTKEQEDHEKKHVALIVAYDMKDALIAFDFVHNKDSDYFCFVESCRVILPDTVLIISETARQEIF